MEGSFTAERLQLARAYHGFQRVEAALRVYISENLALARKLIDGCVRLEEFVDGFENAPMGRLIKEFGKWNHNQDVMNSLEEFRKVRNMLTHRGFIDAEDPDGDLDPEALSTACALALNIEEEAERLLKILHEESSAHRAHLWFDDLSDMQT